MTMTDLDRPTLIDTAFAIDEALSTVFKQTNIIKYVKDYYYILQKACVGQE